MENSFLGINIKYAIRFFLSLQTGNVCKYISIDNTSSINTVIPFMCGLKEAEKWRIRERIKAIYTVRKSESLYEWAKSTESIDMKW